jgi:hypothetical protein
MTVELHESAHASAAIWMRRQVEYVERYPGHFLPGETMGHCRAPIGGGVEASQMVIALAGYLAEGRADWPPDFERARSERLEGLGRLIEILDLDRDEYGSLVAVTREVLADADFQRLRGAIERALHRVPRLEEQDIQALAAAVSVPYEPGEVAA